MSTAKEIKKIWILIRKKYNMPYNEWEWLKAVHRWQTWMIDVGMGLLTAEHWVASEERRIIIERIYFSKKWRYTEDDFIALERNAIRVISMRRNMGYRKRII